MLPPGYAQSLPPGSYPAPGFAPQPRFAPGPMPAQPATYAPVPAQPQQPAFVQQQPPPPRVLRGQAAEEPRPAPVESRPAPLSMPSPEELGVAAARPAAGAPGLDAAHRRLEQLGATCFHLERLPEGGCRATCVLPTA